jgi:hypothetical protein
MFGPKVLIFFYSLFLVKWGHPGLPEGRFSLYFKKYVLKDNIPIEK